MKTATTRCILLHEAKAYFAWPLCHFRFADASALLLFEGGALGLAGILRVAFSISAAPSSLSPASSLLSLRRIIAAPFG
jgi:hypothetical protein